MKVLTIISYEIKDISIFHLAYMKWGGCTKPWHKKKVNIFSFELFSLFSCVGISNYCPITSIYVPAGHQYQQNLKILTDDVPQ